MKNSILFWLVPLQSPWGRLRSWHSWEPIKILGRLAQCRNLRNLRSSENLPEMSGKNDMSRPIGKTSLDPLTLGSSWQSMGSMGSCPLLAHKFSASPAVWKTYQRGWTSKKSQQFWRRGTGFGPILPILMICTIDILFIYAYHMNMFFSKLGFSEVGYGPGQIFKF